MKVFVVGSGGREHALAWRIAQDGHEVFLGPGNDGVRLDPCCKIVNISASDPDAIVKFCNTEKIDFVVVGPDQALADGLVDRLQTEKILAFGPRASAARIEWSKAFAKDLMKRAQIPTARFSTFQDASSAKKFLRNCGWNSGWALKADGLALGKGVVVTQDISEAERTVEEFMIQGQLGAAGKTLVIEERLEGREVSAFYLCDGKDFFSLAYACDYKQIFDGGKGPNTGGMGAYAPADWVSVPLQKEVEEKILAPLLYTMRSEANPFQGVVFIGLMITNAGPHVIEFNARFGDPETQAFLPLLQGDFTGALQAAARGTLATFSRDKLRLSGENSVHLVLAAHGYPGAGGTPVRKGDTIVIAPDLLDLQRGKQKQKVFFAGVKSGPNQNLLTNGGRVLGLSAVANSRAEARALAYAMAEKIQFAGMQKRGDVGL